MKKVCFVVMGFGKKMDYQNSVEVDLDKIYKEVIKPLFNEEFDSYKLIRADEISGSALIDTSMYALLANADLVIADITTLNVNAIYELGVRHAVKPYSTIIMSQKSCSIPFDLSHNRFLTYNDIGENLTNDEIVKIQNMLKEYIYDSEKDLIDSPLYTYFPNTKPIILSREIYLAILNEAENKADSISLLIEEADANMDLDNFKEAIINWNKLTELLPNNEYPIQQLALATYKAKYPNETVALGEALTIINKLNPVKSLNIETLGITGAIYKRLFRVNNNYDYLDQAIKYYKKGFVIQNDYYNGENYANCLLLKTRKNIVSEDERRNLIYNSTVIYKEVIEIINSNIDDNDINIWTYATLSTSYMVIGDVNKHLKYMNLFIENCTVEWQKTTFLDTLDELKLCIDYNKLGGNQ